MLTSQIWRENKMNRHECRTIVMQMIFSSLDNESFDYQTNLNELAENYTMSNEDADFIKNLFDAYKNNKNEIIEKVSEHLKGYEWGRIYKVDKCLILLALSEMLYLKTAPHKVIINEVLELAKEFSTDKSPKFINGVLSNFVGD